MVRIPAGQLVTGGSGMRPIPSFEMDVTEVTVASYQACVEAKACLPAHATAFWPDITQEAEVLLRAFCNAGREGRGQHPINCVDWSQARAYCRWAYKRLPTDEEWEYAARGRDARAYLWNHSTRVPFTGPGCHGCCSSEWFDLTKKEAWKHPRKWLAMNSGNGDGAETSVGSVPERPSPSGVLDMAASVWEWTETKTCETRGASTPCVDARVVRGCCLDNTASPITYVPFRFGIIPQQRGPGLGFRCVR
ncbi:MAG: SUMF1/EgtB/PvdO family nonheme iron enzyme [Polyangiaceae bacterium]|nr:SUMF1/EgtB/PvdO family nonheme iron enzyme [Polyangiaceae bacterium]